MKYLLLRNEESIEDVAKTAYKGLTAKSRTQAEAALLKANPELRNFKEVAKGFIVRVPAVRGGEKADRRNLVGPVDDIAHEMLKRLEAFEDSLPSKLSRMEDRHIRTLEKLKDANKELRKQPNSANVAKTLKDHVADSKKIAEKNRKLALKALAKLKGTLATIN